MNDVGFTIPAGAVSYWVGEAMGSTDFADLKKTPSKVKETVATLARNATHLANLLKQNQYPAAE